jgi:hypothetical protein
MQVDVAMKRAEIPQNSIGGATPHISSPELIRLDSTDRWEEHRCVAPIGD